MRSRVAALSALLIASSAHAQSTSRATTVTGTVYDSVAHAPLSGAVVQIVRVDTTADNSARTFTSTSDAAGRYRIDGLPHGKFGVGFQHGSLTALGLESPLRALQIATDTTLVVDLAIPGAAQVRAEKCPSADATDGMLAGYVLDASRGSTMSGAVVTLGWVEVGLVEKQLRTVPKRLGVKVEDDGTYLACGLPSESPLTITVVSAGYRAILGEISVPNGSAVRRDFRLADTSSAHVGTAITGRVVHADSAAVNSGVVSIAALDVEAPVVNGAFSIPNVPPGTWLVEARVIGYEPQSVFVDVGEGAPGSAVISVGRKVQLLDAVTVVGKATGDIKVLNDIVARSRTSGGTTFLPGNVWLQSALYPADVLSAARGFGYLGMDKVRVRGCSNTSILGPQKQLVIYVDGSRFAGTFSELGSFVNMRDVLAIEAYPDVISIPAQWRTTDACAVVAVWTKR